jgi:hypothetical protein
MHGDATDAEYAEDNRYAQQDLAHAFVLRELVDAAEGQRVGENDGRQHEPVAFLFGFLSGGKLFEFRLVGRIGAAMRRRS